MFLVAYSVDNCLRDGFAKYVYRMTDCGYVHKIRPRGVIVKDQADVIGNTHRQFLQYFDCLYPYCIGNSNYGIGRSAIMRVPIFSARNSVLSSKKMFSSFAERPISS